MKIRLTVRNSGSSPALRSVLINGLVIAPFPLVGEPGDHVERAPKNEVVMYTGIGGRLILPNDTVDYVVPLELSRQSFKVGPEGDVSIWLKGFVGYRDEFDQPHATNFLYRYVTETKRGIRPEETVIGRFEYQGFGAVAY